MRSLLLFSLLPVALCAAPALQITKSVVSQSEGGQADAPGATHIAGETLYFSALITGFAKDPDNKVHVSYTVDALDPKGVPLMETYKNAALEEVTEQDKDWAPKVETEVDIPPLCPPGEYKILVKAEDVIGGTTTELPVTFRVRGHAVEPSETPAVRNFGFYRGENDSQAVASPIFHNGSTLFAKWDITGYKYGEGNKVDISWTVEITQGDKVLKAFDTAIEQSDSFYPKPWVPGSFSVPLQKVVTGQYTLLVRVKDVVGNRTFESRHNFTVE